MGVGEPKAGGHSVTKYVGQGRTRRTYPPAWVQRRWNPQANKQLEIATNRAVVVLVRAGRPSRPPSESVVQLNPTLATRERVVATEGDTMEYGRVTLGSRADSSRKARS